MQLLQEPTELSLGDGIRLPGKQLGVVLFGFDQRSQRELGVVSALYSAASFFDSSNRGL